MSRTKKRQRSLGNIKAIVSLVGSALLIIASLALYLNRQYVVDWIAYHQFTPSAAIAAITTRTDMSGTGKFYFYASKPTIESADVFNKSCDRKESSSAILGCYANNLIHIYDVDNKELDGIKDVTAAHEMLHAAYQRLSGDEKKRVDALLDKEYQSLKNNQDLSERMAFYAKHEAGEESNELHSIVATEVSSISPELETYYKRYFTDRQKVVQLHVSYAGVFASIKNKADMLLKQLKQLGPEIETDSSSYNASVKALNDDIQTFNTRATSGDFSSRAAFDSQRATLVARSVAIDRERARIQSNLEKYETLRQEYNATAATSNDLYKSIDSKLAPSPSV